MEITFVVVTYNQEQLVIQTLESIKYQIQNYGNNNQYTLIVSDDGSFDNTVNNVSLWMEKNNKLFFETILLYDGKNRGTAKNLVRALEYVKDEYFKVIAGDDLICCTDLEPYFKKLDKYHVVTSCTYIVRGGIVSALKNIYSYYASRKNVYLKELIKKENFLIAPETIYSKRSLTEELKKFLSGFDLIEDHPLFVKIFEQENACCIFDSEPMALYRVSEGTVSRSTSLRKRYIKDKIKLEKYLAASSKNIYDKLYHEMKAILWKVQNKKINPLYYAAKIKYIYRDFYGGNLSKKKNSSQIQEKKYQEYYEYIENKARDFLGNVVEKS